MPHNLVQLKRRIAALRDEARAEEDLIAQIRAHVFELELRPEDLFPDGWPSFDSPAPVPSGTASAIAKYADGRGNIWSGIGRRPTWLNEALARGAELDDFLVFDAVKRSAKASRASQPLIHTAVAGVVYRSHNGEEWSGRGRRPNWLVAALEAGALLEDFATWSRGNTPKKS